MPNYRGWVVLAAVVVCFSTWAIIEKTSLGATLRAATENAPLVQAFGVNVPRLITLTYGAGVALAAFAEVLAARRSIRSTRTWAATSSIPFSRSW